MGTICVNQKNQCNPFGSSQLQKEVKRKLHEKLKIKIRRNWKNYNTGTVPLEYIENMHWDFVSGGTCEKTPQPFVYGYVYCTYVEGNIDHSCTHGPPPHSIKICIVKKDNSKEDWDTILKIVGPKPH